jgi:hypothetical protein
MISAGLAVGLLLVGNRALADTIISDELVFTLQNGATTIPVVFDNLHPVIPEDPGFEAPHTSKVILVWDPAKGLVSPKIIVFTEPGLNDISDILRLTVNVDSTVLTFEFTSDNETPLVPPSGDKITIPEAGDAMHSLNNDGFLNVTRDLFPTFAIGQEPASVLVKSADTVVPEPSSVLLLATGVVGLLIGRQRAWKRAREGVGSRSDRSAEQLPTSSGALTPFRGLYSRSFGPRIVEWSLS